MIRHLQRHRIGAHWWDQRLLECRNELWYAKEQVLDLASPGWEALVDDQSGAIMPLTWRRKYGVRYLFQPFALQQLGIFSPAPIDPAQQERMLHAVPPAFRLVDIAVNGEAPPPVIPGWGSTPCANLVVRRDAASVDHRVGYSQGHLRNLRRGTEAEFHSIGTDPFMALFLGTTALRHGPFDKAGLRAVGANTPCSTWWIGASVPCLPVGCWTLLVRTIPEHAGSMKGSGHVRPPIFACGGTPCRAGSGNSNPEGWSLNSVGRIRC
jgi:hypothetical protein